MNQLFSFHRFRLLLKLDFSERGTGFLLMAGLLAALLLLLLLPIILAGYYQPVFLFFHALALFMVVLFGGSLYTSFVFSQYASTDTGITALMLPASRLEKYLSALLVQLLFIIPFTLFFIKFHTWSVGYANSRLPDGEGRYNEIPRDFIHYIIAAHVIIQGAVFLGSLYFRKLAYLKTAGILFGTVLIAGCINYVFAYQSASRPSRLIAFPFSSWKIWYIEAGKNYYVAHPALIQMLVYAFPIAVLLGLWLIAYIRLKEKEI